MPCNVSGGVQRRLRQPVGFWLFPRIFVGGGESEEESDQVGRRPEGHRPFERQGHEPETRTHALPQGDEGHGQAGQEVEGAAATSKLFLNFCYIVPFSLEAVDFNLTLKMLKII